MRWVWAVTVFIFAALVLEIAAGGARAAEKPLVSDVVRRGAPAQERPAEARYWAGVEALGKLDFKAAAEAFHESMRLDPSLPAPLLGMTDLALRYNRPDDAQAWLQKAEALAPQAMEVRTARGRFHFFRGEKDKAEAAYKTAIALDGKAFLPRLDLADLYLSALWKPRDAVGAYRAALAIEPNHAGARYGLGVSLSVTGDESTAIRELERATQLAPANPVPRQALGRLHVARKQYDEALKTFDQGIGSQPGYLPFRVGRAEVLEAKGDIDQAIREYETILTLDPSFAGVNTKLGALHQAQQRWANAETAYLKAIESDPTNSIAYNNLAWMAADRGVRLDDALAWAQRAAELAPTFAGYQDTLGWVHRARGELDKAADVLEKAAAAPPPSADIHYHLGIVYSQQGKKQQAVAAFRKALAIKGNFADAEDARRRLAALGGQ